VPRLDTSVRSAAIVVAVIVGLTGCAKMDAALGQQWFVVQFAPNTTVAAARQVTAACAHLPNLHPEPVVPTTADRGVVDSVRFNSTRASDADMARLELCLQRFPKLVQGFSLSQPGD